MTLRELSNEICALGFNNYAKLDTALVFAARRALTAIYGELRITSRAKLLVSSHTPSTKVARLHHKGGGAEALPLSGKAYAMTVSGQGCVTVYDGANSTEISFNSDSKLIRGFLKQGGRAVFSGETSFDVYNAVTFDEAFGYDVDSIPNGDGVTVIDVRDRVNNFGGFASPLFDESGLPIKNANLSDGAITLNSDFSGEVSFIYRRLPVMPTLTEPDSPIDIPAEYEALLPLLTASYVLLDEESEMAQIYKSAYTEAIESIKNNRYSLCGTGYADVNGWGK